MEATSMIRALVLAATLAPLATYAADFEIKGVIVGKPLTAEGKKNLGDTTIGGVPVRFTYFREHGVVNRAMAFFSYSSFATVENAVRTKYGAPTSTGSQPVTNGFGARMSRNYEIWTNATGDKMTLVDHIDTSDGALLVESAAYLAAEQAKSKKDAHDL